MLCERAGGLRNTGLDTYVTPGTRNIDSPANEPLADIFDANEDANSAPVHGKALDGI